MHLVEGVRMVAVAGVIFRHLCLQRYQVHIQPIDSLLLAYVSFVLFSQEDLADGKKRGSVIGFGLSM